MNARLPAPFASCAPRRSCVLEHRRLEPRPAAEAVAPPCPSAPGPNEHPLPCIPLPPVLLLGFTGFRYVRWWGCCGVNPRLLCGGWDCPEAVLVGCAFSMARAEDEATGMRLKWAAVEQVRRLLPARAGWGRCACRAGPKHKCGVRFDWGKGWRFFAQRGSVFHGGSRLPEQEGEADKRDNWGVREGGSSCGVARGSLLRWG